MKPISLTATLLALAVAVTATTCALGQAQGQSTAPAATDAGTPTDIVPGSPLADVVKMLQAGVDAATIKSYILNSQNAFNLDADKIVYLRDLGASSDIINAMLDRDKALVAASVTPAPAPAPAAAPVPAPEPTPVAAPEPVAAPAPDAAPVAASDATVAPPPADVTVDYFDSTLTPYGSWVDVEGYGRCWRPTVGLYNAAWSPYCDAGHWVYTDYGWYWDSDYAWGITFHYGRWFRSPRFGWCWFPDTVWAPSWVAWRSGGDYCGWAPLPPFAVYRPGVGFFYRGAAVSVDFDFGLEADAFVFVSPDHFCDRRPRSFCVPRDREVAVFHQTTIINNYNVHDRFVVNRGFGPDRIAAATHRAIEPMHVSSLANAGRQGWRGEGFAPAPRPTPANRDAHLNQNAPRGVVTPNNNGGHGSFNGNNEHGLNTVPNNQFHGAPQTATTPANMRPGETTVRRDTPIQKGQGQPQTGGPAGNTRSWGQTTPPATANAQNQFQNRDGGTMSAGAYQGRGETPSQPRQFNAQEQPRPGSGQAQPVPEHNLNPAAPGNGRGQEQAQPRNPGNGGNNGNRPGQNKQGQ